MNTTQLKVKASSMRITSETVRDLLSFSEFDYNNTLFESGMQLLVEIYGLDTDQYLLHSRNKMFWSWYRIQFDHCAASYLSRASNLKHVRNMRPHILVSLFHNDMTFFCVKSRAIKTAFENYLNAYKRYGTRSGKGVQRTAAAV